MELRNGSLVGGSPGILPPQARPVFEEGVRIILHRWTALMLAVENEWGGPGTKRKADEMYEDILAWFYDNKAHYADDLEVDLEEIMTADFNVELEDDSPRLVAKELVSLHSDLLRGDLQKLYLLRQAGGTGAAASKQQVRDADGTMMDGSGSDSSDDEDELMEPIQPLENVAAPKQGPVIDDDGFQLVQTKRGQRNR